MHVRAGAFAVAAIAILATAVAPSVQAKANEAERFEVLQAAFHPLNDLGTTRQSLEERCVLMEQHVEGDGSAAQEGRGAAWSLLANTTRRNFVYAELGPNEVRFPNYYRIDTSPSSPLAVFDGIDRIGGGGPQAQLHAKDAYDEAARGAPRATINVSTNVVISSAHLDYEVFVAEPLAGYVVSIRAFLVEDHATSVDGVHDLRYLVRLYLPGAYIETGPHRSSSGRLNFTLESNWVQSRMAAIVFVQVDQVPVAMGDPPLDFPWVAYAVVFAVVGTASALVLLLWRLVRAERRAKLR